MRTTNIILGALCAAGAVLGAGQTAEANLIEPGLDLDATANPSGGTIISQSIVIHFQTLDLKPGDPWWVDDTITITWGTLQAAAPVNVRGLAYGNLGTSGIDLVTTIYGQAFTPIGTDLQTTGLDPASQVSFSGETIIGHQTGTLYDASWESGPVPLSTLATLPQLQGLDLSPFTGAGSSVVYAFQTLVPDSDLVPEPATLSLLAFGGLGAAAPAKPALMNWLTVPPLPEATGRSMLAGA